MFRNNAVIHDSHHCSKSDVKRFGHVRPFPAKRQGGYWVGSGPRRSVLIERMKKNICPEECRPPDHMDWTNC